jgi:hypothetical protein
VGIMTTERTKKVITSDSKVGVGAGYFGEEHNNFLG